MSVRLSETQAKAIAEIRDWYQNRRSEQQVFRLFGYAGTGKSTILTEVIAALGLEPMATHGGGGVLFGAFTGKAVSVMRRKGTPAQTIHSLIYRCSDPTPEEIARVKADLATLKKGRAAMGPGERTFADLQIRQLELRLRDIHQPRFVINEQSLLREADLLVLDEVSMVGSEMALDLLAFGRPILVIGDPGQLPPVKSTGFFVTAAPDVMLSEIHRQAADSPILRLATMARLGEPVPFGAYDTNVWKMRHRDISPAQMIKGGQVICGTNARRRYLNTAMKHAAGFDGSYPTGAGEKIICLRNRHDLGLINGVFVTLSDVRFDRFDDVSFTACATTEDGLTLPGRHSFYRGEYDDHIRFDRNREQRDWQARRGLIESGWGYAITCHKAQGSQFSTAVVVDDGFGHTPEAYNRWLYTAITRAEWGLVILG